MCVSCMFKVDWELEGQKKLKGRDFLSKNLLGSGYRKQTILFRSLRQLAVSDNTLTSQPPGQPRPL